jgi:hypothetical protein
MLVFGRLYRYFIVVYTAFGLVKLSSYSIFLDTK